MDEFTLRRAERLLEAGLFYVTEGDLEAAKEKFEASSIANPTADSLTYWGWMEHHLGNTERAIDLCKQAIQLDPEFGNPYNDIGSYLVSKGREDDAIPWFEMAIRAPRYEPRQFPHINLGRVFMLKNMPVKALREFKNALKYSPDDVELLEIIREIQATIG